MTSRMQATSGKDEMSKHSKTPWIYERVPNGSAAYVYCDDSLGSAIAMVLDATNMGIRHPADVNGALMAAAPEGLACAEMLYRKLLSIQPGSPHYILRIESQGELAALRDFIAKATGRSAEEVQNEYEAESAPCPTRTCTVKD